MDFKAKPCDLDCSLLGWRSSGGSKGSILGPSRLLEDGEALLVWGTFFVLDGCVGDFVVFADFGGFEAFVVSEVLFFDASVVEDDVFETLQGGFVVDE